MLHAGVVNDILRPPVFCSGSEKGTLMDASLHHASVATRDLARSVAFYRDVIGLNQMQRPPFAVDGAWFAAGSLQVHVILTPAGTFRTSQSINTGDIHFALRVNDFERAMRKLESLGYREDLPAGDPKAMVVRRAGPAGFPQVYVTDPDNNIVEINGAA
jgi:catechol 2,3-dioxygenase-like lactoylglutathione lyase family enzyme